MKSPTEIARINRQTLVEIRRARVAVAVAIGMSLAALALSLHILVDKPV
jgi:hypothetical protein